MREINPSKLKSTKISKTNDIYTKSYIKISVNLQTLSIKTHN